MVFRTPNPFRPFDVSLHEPGRSTLRLDFVFEDRAGREIGRDSRSISLLVTDGITIQPEDVIVDGQQYQVSTQSSPAGDLTYSVTSRANGAQLADPLIRDKAIYTAALQQEIRARPVSFYRSLQFGLRGKQVAAHISKPVTWVLARPGQLGMAVIKGASAAGPHGAVVALLAEVTVGTAIDFIKQIGGHPEAYTEEVALELIDEGVRRNRYVAKVQIDIAQGEILSFEEAIRLENDARFRNIFSVAAFKTIDAIRDQNLNWNRNALEAGIDALSVATGVPVGDLIAADDYLNLMAEVNSPLQSYPPFNVLTQGITNNRRIEQERYLQFLESLGLTDPNSFALQVFGSATAGNQDNGAAQVFGSATAGNQDNGAAGELLWRYQTRNRVHSSPAVSRAASCTWGRMITTSTPWTRLRGSCSGATRRATGCTPHPLSRTASCTWVRLTTTSTP
jgi:hypothetical protein